MQIPSIRNFVAFPVNYFLESSWQGKTVQVLGAVSILALIYLAFRKKAPPKGPTPTGLSGRVGNHSSVKNPTNGSKASSMTSSSRPQPRIEKSSKNSATSTITPPNRAQTQPKELPKADLSYIQKTQVSPDIKWPESEFDIWLSYQMSEYPQWVTMCTSLKQTQEGFCRRELKKCISGLKEQAQKRIPVFEKYGVKRPDGNAFLQDCNEAEVGPKTNLVDFCMKLKGYLDRLQSWNTALHKLKEKQLMEKLKDCPHYEFTNQAQYFHYLSLHTEADFSRLISANITHLEAFGLRQMEDIDCLQLRAMQPSIERLRQLFCFLTIHGVEKAHSQILRSVSKEQEGLSLTQSQSKIVECVSEETLHSRIEKEIKKCREVLKMSNKLSDALNNVQDGQDLKKTVNLLNGLFDELSRNFVDGLDLLKEIENNDIARQLILLKGYINQYGQKAKWQQLNEMGIFRLARYDEVFKPTTFYQMGD